MENTFELVHLGINTPSPEEAEASGEPGEMLCAVVTSLAAFTGVSQKDLLRPLVRMFHDKLINPWA